MAHQIDSSSSSIDVKVSTPTTESQHSVSHGRAPFFRSTIWQATVVGACAFLSPGIWGSMNSLGAGGAQEPYLVNAANSLVFGMMVVTCLLASSITNVINYKWALLLGTVGYAPYAAGLYENKLHGTVWLVLFGAFTCGVSAGLFWGVEGAIVLGYPEEHKRGKYLAYWLGWRNGGQLLGGIINLALNVHANKVGSVSSNTYLVFIALQSVAPLFALLLSNPEHVIRNDRTPIRMEHKATFKQEMKDMWSLIKRREVLYLTPLALYTQWAGPYTGTFLSLYFSVRARALASFSVAIAGVLANTLLGIYLDRTGLRKSLRAKGSYGFVMGLSTVAWTWFTVVQVKFLKMHPAPKLDWVDGSKFANAWTLYLIWYITYYLLQNEMYWLMSQLARHPTEMVRLSSFLRALESAGAAAAFGVSARKSLPKTVPLALNYALFGISAIVGWGTVKDIGTGAEWEVIREEEEKSASNRKETTVVA